MTTTVQHAIKALLWGSTVEQDGKTFAPYGVYEASPELIERISEEWEQFSDKAMELGFDPEEHRELMVNKPVDGDEWAHCAHDWIFTRQRTGYGFEEPGKWFEPWGEKLTKLTLSELKDKELYLYIDDNNQISAEEG